MNSTDPKREQVDKLLADVTPMLGYLMSDRTDKRGMGIEPLAELTVKQAAVLLGVSVTTVWRRIADGSLIARNASVSGVNRPAWRIPAEAVLAKRNGYGVQKAQ